MSKKWTFKIKQDGLIVANGFCDNKELAVNEAFRYLSQYAEEEFGKMTLEIREGDKPQNINNG